MGMETNNTDQPRTESWLEVVSMFGVGLGILTFALFPFLIPGLAILALIALPLIPLLIPLLLLIPLWLMGRAIARRLSRRGRSGRAPAAAWGPQAGQSR
jgi:hypothetical protein